MKISKQKIEQFFQLKPTRAVDIIFSQNKIDQVYQFYSNIQDNKKNNTILLKKTLQNNYQKMLYCSELLDKVKKYGEAVKQVTLQIQGEISNQENIMKKNGQKIENQAQKIQSLIRNYKFSSAMTACNQSAIQKRLSNSDRYYISYLRIEIINKMDRHISINRLNQASIQEYINCLQEFLFAKSNQGVGLRQGVQRWSKDYNQKSIIGLVSKRIKELQQIKSQIETKPILLQILFEYKLRTVRNKFKHLSTPTYFEHYFQQMAIIIKLYKSIRIQTSGNLRRIFKDCTSHVKSQLASIFIQKLPSGEIIFKSELYDQLISSPLFQANIHKFHKQISENDAEYVEHPIKFIKQLWHDYFINLIDVFVSHVNPLTRITTMKQHSASHDNLPRQLQIYLHDYSLQQSIHIITEYHEKIELLLKNIVPIIKKCNKDELQSFKNKFDQKIKQIRDKCGEYMHKLQAQKTILAFRKYILLRILTGMLENQILQINRKYSINLQVNQINQVYQQSNLQVFWPNFVLNQQDCTLIDSFIEFDAFFIGYVEGVRAQFKQIVTESISQIAIKILTYVQKQIKGRQKQLLNYTLQSIKQKKQKVTILQSIVVPYLAQRIFKTEMKEVKIQKTLFEKRFICKLKPIIAAKVVEPFNDQFQIGQKDQKEQFVKVNNIGKSIVNMGTSLITGFIKKK